MNEWRIESPESLAFAGIRRLQIRLVEGELDVVGRPTSDGDDNTYVEVTELDRRLVISRDGDTLVISHERLTWDGLFDWIERWKCHAAVSVSLPSDCAVDIGLITATGVVAGISAPTRIKSVSGNVTLDGVIGPLEARTVSGNLETRGLVGPLDFTTVSGDLTVVEGSSSALQVETVSGQITLDIGLPADGRINLTSVSGDLTVRLPATVDMQVDLKTMSGELDSAFAEVTTRSEPLRNRLRGQVGDGSALLQGKTVSGDVTLLRRAGP